jgi:flagellar hook protein FlgE
MIRSLFTGISGLTNSQERMDVIGNNLANVNTVGFKASRVSFADSISQTLKASSPATTGTSGDSSMQVGTGVTTSGISTLYNAGAVSRTSVPTDLALVGEGYFVVKDTVTSEQFATRAGDFRVDSNGYLVTSAGLRVQGFSPAAGAALDSALGDVKIQNPTAGSTATVDGYSFGSDGKVNVRLSDGTQAVSGQILLQKFNDPQALMKVGNSLYSGISNAGPLTWAAGGIVGIPNQAGIARIESGALELANVDMATEFTNMITTQRAYQASARVISTSDELLQELVNLKR